jgi:hypothetical protein
MAAEVFAQISLPANTNTTVYTTIYTARITIRVINRTNTQQRVYIGIAETSTPTDAEYIEYNSAIEPYSVLEISELPVGTGHNIVAR